MFSVRAFLDLEGPARGDLPIRVCRHGGQPGCIGVNTGEHVSVSGPLQVCAPKFVDICFVPMCVQATLRLDGSLRAFARACVVSACLVRPDAYVCVPCCRYLPVIACLRAHLCPCTQLPA